MRPEIQVKDLALTAPGAAGPNQRKKCQPFTAGDNCARDGSRMAETAKGGLGLRKPGPLGCAWMNVESY